MSTIRVRSEDIKKIADYLDKNANGELVSIRIDLMSLILNVTTVQRESVTIKATDHDYHLPVKIVKEENL